LLLDKRKFYASTIFQPQLQSADYPRMWRHAPFTPPQPVLSLSPSLDPRTTFSRKRKSFY